MTCESCKRKQLHIEAHVEMLDVVHKHIRRRDRHLNAALVLIELLTKEYIKDGQVSEAVKVARDKLDKELKTR